MLIGNKNSLWGEKEISIYNDALMIYSLRNYFEWEFAVLKIRRSSDNTTKFVFFDGDTITLNSLVGDSNSVRSVTTLGDWVGIDDGYVEEWISQSLEGINVDNISVQITTTLQPKIISSGVIITKNGTTAILFNNSILISNNLTYELADELEFSIITVSSSSSLDIRVGIFSQSNNTNHFSVLHDNKATKYNSLVRTGATYYINSLLSIHNDLNQHLKTTVKRVLPYELDGYFNGTFQQSSIYTTGYAIATHYIGQEAYTKWYHIGEIQEIIIFPSDKTSDLTDLHNDINNYYSIY